MLTDYKVKCSRIGCNNYGCCYLHRRRRLCFWFGLFVCLSVSPSDYLQTCERILTKFFGGVGHGSRTKWYNFGGDPNHASDPGVQSPKSGSSGSAEVYALWVLLVIIKMGSDQLPGQTYRVDQKIATVFGYCCLWNAWSVCKISCTRPYHLHKITSIAFSLFRMHQKIVVIRIRMTKSIFLVTI